MTTDEEECGAIIGCGCITIVLLAGAVLFLASVFCGMIWFLHWVVK